MLTVGKDGAAVERRLAQGRLACPGCGQRLGPWGYARPRVLREQGVARRRLRPRRARCAGCGRTHVLLPVSVLVRRADAAVVIGAALVVKAAGWGHRQIAVWLGRPASTVRGWLRRFAVQAEPLRAAFTMLLCELDPDPEVPEPAGSAVADAVVAILAAAGAVGRRWPGLVFGLSPWEVAAAVTGGRLLGPGSAVGVRNTNCPW
ncbi:MAG TPA: helix-turn-helix domain-containing protein [Actinomycetes bacterium]|nr:helix-turn-helix domain-containing protein [Actinomycetes bacterium]